MSDMWYVHYLWTITINYLNFNHAFMFTPLVKSYRCGEFAPFADHFFNEKPWVFPWVFPISCMFTLGYPCGSSNLCTRSRQEKVKWMSPLQHLEKTYFCNLMFLKVEWMWNWSIHFNSPSLSQNLFKGTSTVRIVYPMLKRPGFSSRFPPKPTQEWGIIMIIHYSPCS